MSEQNETPLRASRSYASDIRPKFRETDINAMRFAFDLGSYDDVCQNAEAIFERMEDGTMPCDVRWSDEDLHQFRSWIDTGMRP